jgi:serine/threonine-protein kinase
MGGPLARRHDAWTVALLSRVEPLLGLYNAPVSRGPERDFGRYRILSELGHGGMGTVFRARDVVLRRDLALKLLRSADPSPGSPPAPEGVARLLREARAAAAINHPNAVSIYDVGEVEGTPYIAMELVEGRTLRDLMGSPSLSVAIRVEWLVQIARALAAAHARGVIHRDVKPENIIVRHDGVLKVLDFGIAKQLAAGANDSLDTMLETKPGTWVGTPAYMAPEQIRGEPADVGSDQFTWGVVAYELLAGERPWGGDLRGLRAIAEMVSRDPIHVCARNREVARPLGDVVMRAIERERSARFGSLNALLASLDAAGVAALPAVVLDEAVLAPDAGGTTHQDVGTEPATPLHPPVHASEQMHAAARATTVNGQVMRPAGPRRRSTVAVVAAAAAAIGVVLVVQNARRAVVPATSASQISAEAPPQHAAEPAPPAASVAVSTPHAAPESQPARQPAAGGRTAPASLAGAGEAPKLPAMARSPARAVRSRPARRTKPPVVTAAPEPEPPPPPPESPKSAGEAAGPTKAPANPYEDPH